MNWSNLLFSFNGRTGRKGFWIVTLLVMVVYLVLWGIAFAPMMAAASSQDPAAMEAAAAGFPFWVWIVMIPLIWIGLAVQAKRWHDQDKSAWWILIGLVPFVGGLIVLIMCGFIAGTPGPNRFGDVPTM